MYSWKAIREKEQVTMTTETPPYNGPSSTVITAQIAVVNAQIALAAAQATSQTAQLNSQLAKLQAQLAAAQAAGA